MNQIFGDATMTVPRRFDEKAYRRQSLAEWDSRWQRLSSTARYYFAHVYFVDQFTEVLGGLLRAAGIAGLSRLGDLLDRYVIDHHWPERVAASLREPLAKKIFDVVQIAKGPIPLAESKRRRRK